MRFWSQMIRKTSNSSIHAVEKSEMSIKVSCKKGEVYVHNSKFCLFNLMALTLEMYSQSSCDSLLLRMSRRKQEQPRRLQANKDNI